MRARDRRLVALGVARANTRRNGVPLPEARFDFPVDLRSQLLAFAFATLRQALQLRARAGKSPDDVVRIAFEAVGESLGAVVQNDRSHSDSGFYQVVSAVAYHLGRYSARAYFALPSESDDSNLSIPESLLVHLLRRDFASLRRDAFKLVNGAASDSAASELVMESTDLDDVIPVVASGAFAVALAQGVSALQSGDARGIDQSRARLIALADAMMELGVETLWWDARLAVELLDDLWELNLHRIIPPEIPGQTATWPALRQAYITDAREFIAIAD